MSYMKYLRSFVGPGPIILPASAVIIMNEQGDVLLQKRADDGLWGIPGGAMELGESYEETAAREVKEETGLVIKSLKLYHIFSGEEYFNKYPNGDQAYNALAVYITRDYEGKLNLSDHENLEQRFWDTQNLPELSLITKKVLNQFLNSGEK